MSKCVFVNGTRVCTDSPTYQVKGLPGIRDFPAVVPSQSHAAARRSISGIGTLSKAQKKLANDLLDAVCAVHWTGHNARNAQDIVECVKLLLVKEVGAVTGGFTLVSYVKPKAVKRRAVKPRA